MVERTGYDIEEFYNKVYFFELNNLNDVNNFCEELYKLLKNEIIYGENHNINNVVYEKNNYLGEKNRFNIAFNTLKIIHNFSNI